LQRIKRQIEPEDIHPRLPDKAEHTRFDPSLDERADLVLGQASYRRDAGDLKTGRIRRNVWVKA